MLKNFVPARQAIHVERYIVFDDAEGNGYAFPCDMSGYLQPMSDEAKANYEKCMASPDEFIRYNEFVKCQNTYTEAAHGTCLCGADVEIWNQYYGACQCENCGRWYNQFGQNLLPPEQWEIDPGEAEPW